MSFKDKLLKFMGFVKKEKEEPGCIGHYDSKPFHNFKYALIYANEILLTDDDNEDTASIMVFTREYKKTTFINVLVYKEDGFDITKYHYDELKPMLESKGITPCEKSVVVVLFQHYNEETIKQCKKFCNSDKKHFEQGIIFNPRKVQMDFYKPVPTFYRLYDIFCEDIYFDLAFIDDKRD